MIAVLPMMAPRTLEEAIGYEGDRPCIGLFWTPEMRAEGTGGGWAVRISDGYHEWLGNVAGWLTFVGHPAVAPHLQKYGFRFGDDAPTMILIVERETRTLMLYEFGEGLAFLAEQNGPVTSGTAGSEDGTENEVEVTLDPSGNLPLTVIELPGEPGEGEIAALFSGGALGGPYEELPLEPYDADEFRALLAESLRPVDALRDELDRMQQQSGGTLTLH